jgi:hypothetical protein
MNTNSAFHPQNNQIALNHIPLSEKYATLIVLLINFLCDGILLAFQQLYYCYSHEYTWK